MQMYSAIHERRLRRIYIVAAVRTVRRPVLAATELRAQRSAAGSVVCVDGACRDLGRFVRGQSKHVHAPADSSTDEPLARLFLVAYR